MLLESALRAYLLTRTAVTAIVADRIHLTETVPEAGTLPDLYFQVSNGTYEDTFDGQGEELQFPVVELTARSLNAGDVVRLCHALVNALRWIPGARITVEAETAAPFETIDFEDTGTDLAPDAINAHGTTRYVYRRSVTVTLGFRDNAELVDPEDSDAPDNRVEQRITLTAEMAQAQRVTLDRTPRSLAEVRLLPVGGCEQQPTTDFGLEGNVLLWDSAEFGLYGVLTEGDALLVTFPT